MHLPEWLTFVLRIVVPIALIPSALHAFRRAQGDRPLSRTARTLLATLVLLLIGGFVVLLLLP